MEGSLHTELDALVRRCADALAVLAARGGPTVETHLDELRRSLARRRAPSAGRRARLTVATIRSGNADVPDERQLTRLVHDLRAVDRALARTVRIGDPSWAHASPSNLPIARATRPGGGGGS